MRCGRSISAAHCGCRGGNGRKSFSVCIPILVMTHVFGTRVAELTLDVHNTYETVLLALWVGVAVA
jgi:hypothetical protein